MNRFAFVLDATTNPQQPTLHALAHAFADAVDSAAAEGAVPDTDPAVLMMGALIAFRTHADVNTALGHRQLLHRCVQRLHDMRPA